MRTTNSSIGSIPVTTRQLEALIRMTEARARIELATEATVKHARDVLAILKSTMHYGPENITKPKKPAKPLSFAKECTLMVTLMTNARQRIFHKSELKFFFDANNFSHNLDEIIKKLNGMGHLLVKPDNQFQFCE